MGKKKLPEIEYESYENCRFCKLKAKRGCFGCKQCKKDDEKAAAREEEARLQLEASCIFTAHFDNPDEMASLKDSFHADRLTEFFSGSDITDEEVVQKIGGPSVLAMTVGRIIQQQDNYWSFGSITPDIEKPKAIEEIRTLVIEKKRSEMAMERGHLRLIESLRGKAGAGPAVETILAATQ